MGKYGTNLEGFGGFEGGVNADKGAPLISTSSDGATALLFGPAALREIQAGVANGDFAIPPDEADQTITSENPLPYWTFTDSSAGAITCAIVSDSGSGSGNILRWTVAANTASKSALIFRNVPIAATRDRAYAYSLEVTAGGSSNILTRDLVISLQYLKADQTNTGTAISRTYDFADFINTSTGLFIANTERLNAPADAAYAQIVIQVAATTTDASSYVIDLYEVKLIPAQPMILVADRSDPATYGPGAMWKANGITSVDTAMPTSLSAGYGKFQVSASSVTVTSPFISSDAGTGIDAVLVQTGNLVVNDTSGGADQITIPDTTAGAGLTIGGDTNLYRSAADTLKTDDSLAVSGNIGVDGNIYFDSTLTGPFIQQGGTNGRIISVANATGTSGTDLLASTSGSRSGILVTKSVTGQPTTTLNGTGATDAFADVLRNGGIAVDSTNNRGYFYSGGWKYAALTTPSDSRLKDEITEISGALDTLRQLMPVAFKWKRPEAHGRSDAVADDGTRLGFIADQVATTDLAHWVETLGVDEREADLVDTTEVLAVNIPQNEMEALVVQALLDIDTRLKALESR